MGTPKLEGYLSTREVGDALGVAVGTVCGWVRQGKIPGARRVPHPPTGRYAYMIPEEFIRRPETNERAKKDGQMETYK